MGNERKAKLMARAARRRLARGGPAPAVGRPGYRAPDEKPLRLAEVPPPGPLAERLINAENSYLRVYRMGECGVIVTRERGRWHLSISTPYRLPTWREVAEARYRLLPSDLVCGMVLPPPAAYVNVHEHCLHIHEISDDNPEFRP